MFDFKFDPKEPPKNIEFVVFDNKDHANDKKDAIGLVRIPFSQLQSKEGEWGADKSYEIQKDPEMTRMDKENYFGNMYLQAAYIEKPKKGRDGRNGGGKGKGGGILKKGKYGNKGKSKFDEKNNTSDTFGDEKWANVKLEEGTMDEITDPAKLAFEKKKFFLKEHRPAPS